MTSEPETKLKGKRWKTAVSLLTSVPAFTLLFLLLIDAWLRQGNPADAWGYRSVDEWNLPSRIELTLKEHPDVALIGSSLLLVLNQDEHGKKFYSGSVPILLQNELRKKLGKPVNCVNLCTGLQVVSEAYLITEAITQQPRYPKVLIFGVALRDFIHDQYAAEWRCDSFNSVAPYVPMTFDVMRNISNRTALQELILNHFWYLYRNRTDFGNVLAANTKDLLEHLPLDKSFARLGADHLYHYQRRGFLFERWVPRQQEAFTEGVYKSHPEFLKQYFGMMQAGIYMGGNERTMAIQTHYLERLIALCKQKGITLVLVDMPLSPEMAALVPPDLYDAFRKFLGGISHDRGVALIDFFDDPAFDSPDFKDGVHLNYEGAQKLSTMLVTSLQNRYPAIVQNLKASASAAHQ